MSIRRTGKVRGGAAVAVAAVLAFTLAGCGGGGGDDGKPKASGQPSPSASPANGSQPAPGANKSAAPAEILATSNGAAGIVLTINSAVRESGGFITISGQIKNGGSEAFVQLATWRGEELKANDGSVAGATLVDKVGKKRYYVLRDTESRCLCTTGITRIGAGESIPFFAQFPAPPTSTTEVDFNLPTFATATIKISG
ncbi:hypothetical protein ACFV4Q_32310 [Streptomyces nojiriensis]|uniref:hypothetical protein n=1 Tax=Streptomyces nojiriensis TaxID=66374 RepID=UPI0036679555